MRIHTIRSIARRFLLISFMLIALVSVANAYTVVMKGGRRVEIPSKFIVTQTTLTYEVQPGIQVTLQLAAIDVSATEKINNEKPGALLSRGQVSSVPVASRISSARSLNRTITNRDLEAAARRRLDSEAAYEKRMKELGLPSAAESRKRAEAATAIAQEELHDRLASERQSEEYWRSRATAMRTEMAALEAELLFIRRKLDEGPYPYWGNTYSSFGNYFPFVSFGVGGGAFGVGGGQHFPGFRPHGARVYSARGAVGPQFSGRMGFGGRPTRSHVFSNPGHAGRGFFGGGFRSGGNVIGGVGALGTVFASGGAYDYSYERNELISRFNELSISQAGLKSRWRELEEEARRAGAVPGWLRP
ncbi:MAG TPA: hypothetical protein VJU86_21870 [Pyrinomonadaceae bacterium]|nr:hypothetical protein [Pyrinomonadaceae bacterium]